MMLYKTCRRCGALWNSDAKAHENRCPICSARTALQTLCYGSCLQLTMERRMDGLYLGCKIIGGNKAHNTQPLERSDAKEAITAWVDAWLDHFEQTLMRQEETEALENVQVARSC